MKKHRIPTCHAFSLETWGFKFLVRHWRLYDRDYFPLMLSRRKHLCRVHLCRVQPAITHRIITGFIYTPKITDTHGYLPSINYCWVIVKNVSPYYARPGFDTIIPAGTRHLFFSRSEVFCGHLLYYILI